MADVVAIPRKRATRRPKLVHQFLITGATPFGPCTPFDSSTEYLCCIVINDILDVSRMEAGKFKLDPIDFDLRDAIGDMANSVALKAHQKGLELIVDVDESVSTSVRGDPGRLRQILVNLIGNAIKFTPQGEVVLRVVADASTSHHVALRFSVTDTGIGIPLDKQGRVFDAFTQADGTTTRRFGGTGLGLTIAAQLVGLMGGRIRQRERGRDVRLPIVAMTAHAMKGDEARCLAAGMDGYVSKPLDPDQFLDVIERHLDISSVIESGPTLSLRKTESGDL